MNNIIEAQEKASVEALAEKCAELTQEQKIAVKGYIDGMLTQKALSEGKAP